MRLASIIGRPDLAQLGDVDGTLAGSMASGVLVGSGMSPTGFTDPDAGVRMVEPDRPSYTDAQDARMIAPVDGVVTRAMRAGAQHWYAAEYADEPALNGLHGVVVGRPVLVEFSDVTVWQESPEPVWREPPREDRPDLCGRSL